MRKRTGCLIAVGLFVLVSVYNRINYQPPALSSVTPQSLAAAPLATIAPTVPVAPTDTPIPATPVPTNTPAPTSTRAWYSGGTLHRATWREWQQATPENKLATAADWIAAVDRDRGDYHNDNELLQLSVAIVACTDEVAETAIASWGIDSSVVDMAATCLLSLMPKED